jgi:hypothetical protein
LNNVDLIKNYCEYLTFRSFYTGFPLEQQTLPYIGSVDDAIVHIRETLSKLTNPALLLSGGMDSAVLLPFMPKGSTAYTIYHDRLETNEVEIAKSYCDKFSINHVAISIDPDESFYVIDELMINKKMPLSPAEPMFYLAAKKACEDGYKEIVTGGGADAKFGGFTRFRQLLVSSQYQKKLHKRYLNPENILQESTNLNDVFEQYLIPPPKIKRTKNILKWMSPRKGNHSVIDSKRFLREVTLERFAYDNAINLAGGIHVAPYNQFMFDFDEELNFVKPKYFIQNLYLKIYGQEAPKKLGLQKPTYMLKDYKPTNLQLFKKNINMSKMKYPQKFLMYSLERFEKLRQDGLV